jgi:hypothetical protein
MTRAKDGRKRNVRKERKKLKLSNPFKPKHQLSDKEKQQIEKAKKDAYLKGLEKGTAKKAYKEGLSRGEDKSSLMDKANPILKYIKDVADNAPNSGLLMDLGSSEKRKPKKK